MAGRWTARGAGRLAGGLMLLLGGGPSLAQTAGDGANPVQGGPGGQVFRIGCERNQFVTGITVRAGAWINAIEADCSILTPARDRFFPGAPRSTGWTGGPDGAARRVACAANQYASGIKYGFTRNENRPQYLDYVQLNCQPLLPTGNASALCLDSGGNGCWDRHPRPGRYNGFGLSFTSGCAPGRSPDALVGRSGAYVDALAVHCALRP